MVSKEDIESQYKKALKALDGEKRAAIKKAKALKGKKGKDALEQVEQEFSTKLQELESKHAEELAQVPVGEEEAAVVVVSLDTTDETCGDNPATLPVKTPPVEAGAGAVEEQGGNEGLSEKERKLEKARRKKEKQRLKELEKERELEEIAANAGPNMRVVEMEQIQSTLKPLQLSIQEVAADGHCLYRAIGAQTQQDYQQVRKYMCTGMRIRVLLLAQPTDNVKFFLMLSSIICANSTGCSHFNCYYCSQEHYVPILWERIGTNFRPFVNLLIQSLRLTTMYTKCETVPNGVDTWNCEHWVWLSTDQFKYSKLGSRNRSRFMKKQRENLSDCPIIITTMPWENITM